MVGVVEEEEEKKRLWSESMAPPERSRPLHNFDLPTLRWGAQRHLRCMKINHTQQSIPPPPPPQRSETAHPFTAFTHQRSPPARFTDFDDDGDDDGIDAVREKLISDLRLATDRMKITMLEENQNQNQQKGVSEPNSNATRPCNLRTRRAACKEPQVMESPKRASGGGGGGGGGGNLSNKPPDSPVVTRLRGLTAAANTARQSLERGENSQKPKFSIELTREEIEHDFLLITGKKPPRRPKKRPRIVQKKVNACCPGLWLSSDITPDSYKVPELPDSGKA